MTHEDLTPKHAVSVVHTPTSSKLILLDSMVMTGRGGSPRAMPHLWWPAENSRASDPELADAEDNFSADADAETPKRILFTEKKNRVFTGP